MIILGAHIAIKGDNLILIPMVCPMNIILQYRTETIRPIPKPTDLPLFLVKRLTGKAKKTNMRHAKVTDSFLCSSSLYI